MSFLQEFIHSLPDTLGISVLLPFAKAEMWEKDPQFAAMTSLAASGRFDADAYLKRYGDVYESDWDPIQHFVLHGIHEGRSFQDRITRHANPKAIADKNEPDATSKALGLTHRPSVKELCGICAEYDVISLDIFDTALLRRVEFPRDIFAIMAMELHWSDFARVRSKAEEDARANKRRREGHSEITLSEIYDLLEQRHGLDRAWMNREIELEKSLIEANPYILALYRRLKSMGKIMVFSSDMYLPKAVLEEMLTTAGYEGYHHFYLSNDMAMCKGDGSLQKRLLADFAGLRVIHVGDNQWGDVKQSLEAGLDAVLYEHCRPQKRIPYMNNLAGSLIQAVINNTINNGSFASSLHYAHGFCCGGPLAAGYCQHVNLLAKQLEAEKILFCGRDCYLIKKVYDAHYGEHDSVYVETSRMALMLLSPRRYADDLLHRFVFRRWDDTGGQLTQEQLLVQTGFAYLAPFLEKNGLNRFTFCCDARKDVFRDFFLGHIDQMEQAAEPSRAAAKKYFLDALGDAKSVVIVDVGWSGSCIEALEYFISREIRPEIKVAGSLVCASAERSVADKIEFGHLTPYVSGPGFNGEIHAFLYPPKVSPALRDRRRLPLEYLFAAPTASALGYQSGSDGSINIMRDSNAPANLAEIAEMHEGILDFNARYAAVCANGISPFIPGSTAFSHLLNRLHDDNYLKAVYGNFCYDACTLPSSTEYPKFSSILLVSADAVKLDPDKKYILFITLELTYTGTPHSLLRTARIVRQLGFEPLIWSPKDGSFRKEFETENMLVQIVKAEEIEHRHNLATLKACSLAWCNTVFTAKYADILRNYLPTVWFIREAGNIAAICNSDSSRIKVLRKFENIYCPSEYAKNAISALTCQPVKVLHNCVPDQSEFATGHVPGSGKKIKFIQLGTLEFRKGYDVLIKAFLTLPLSYREKSELHFAGGFISFAAPYCEWLFQEIEEQPDIHYHGQIHDMQMKIELISNMDVVVVASRDESCSLVALEGAMLGKPLLLTENVGAKYMVSPKNGRIVRTGDVASLRTAMMEFIDKRTELAAMGRASRDAYEQKASMPGHKKDIENLLRRLCPDSFSDKEGLPAVVISLTSHPKRMKTIMPCIHSLLAQDYGNFTVHLWLAEEQFPCREAELPVELVELAQQGELSLHWVQEDLKPHKKYIHVMRQYPDLPVILVDDDVIYQADMARRLMESYARHPDSVSCHRANMMMFHKDGSPRNYLTWLMDYRHIVDTPSMRLMPTGIGGVLYPPCSLPKEAFDIEVIKGLCLFADDIWLKMMSLVNGRATVLALENRSVTEIPNSQDVALWRTNVISGGNDSYLNDICDYMIRQFPGFSDILYNLRNDMIVWKKC